MKVLSVAEEIDLIILLKEGERDAFAQLYHSYRRNIYNTLKKLLRSEEQAQELLQETFFKLWVNREKLNTDKPIAGYLNRIAANLVYDQFRKAAADRKLQAHLIATGSELYNHIDDLVHFKESNDQFQTAVASLPPQRQKIYRLCKIEGKTYEEVSDLLGIAPSTIQDHIVKATKIIKQHLLGSHETAILLIISLMTHRGL